MLCGKALFFFTDKQTRMLNSYCGLLQTTRLDASWSRNPIAQRSHLHHILKMRHFSIRLEKFQGTQPPSPPPPHLRALMSLDGSVLIHTQKRLLCSHVCNWTELKGKDARIQSNCCLWTGCENAPEMSLCFKGLFTCYAIIRIQGEAWWKGVAQLCVDIQWVYVLLKG